MQEKEWITETKKAYWVLQNLTIDQLQKLIDSTENDAEKNFYLELYNSNIQKAQKKIINEDFTI